METLVAMAKSDTDYSMRLPSDVRKRLEEAREATGRSMAWLILECVSKCLDDVERQHTPNERNKKDE
jgi:predicted DNA-binding protein